MNIATRPAFDSTSGAGAMLAPRVRKPALVGVMLAGLGTSAGYEIPPDAVLSLLQAIGQTISGASVSVAAPPGASIGELRRLSGLTWDQLARLFHVSCRSLHFWASGKPMAPSNEEHLQRLLALVRKVDRGSASANRALLLGAREGGVLPFDLLAAREYERVVAVLGLGEMRGASPPEISKEARVKRAPRRPEDLVGALQDRIHRDGGRARAAKSVRVRSVG